MHTIFYRLRVVAAHDRSHDEQGRKRWLTVVALWVVPIVGFANALLPLWDPRQQGAPCPGQIAKDKTHATVVLDVSLAPLKAGTAGFGSFFPNLWVDGYVDLEVQQVRSKTLGALGVIVLLVAPSATAAASNDQAENAWLDRKVLNIAHQGGEIEAPSNTLFAFKTALAKGAEVLELDVHATADRELVVLHDTTVDRTTDGEGRVDQMTLEEIKQLDAAYWFVPDCGTCPDEPDGSYSYRGLALSEKRLPGKLGRYEPNDFKIPTLREVLEAFPEELINIEIKATAPDTTPYEKELAELLQEFERDTDTIVVSFLDHAVEIFKTWAPEIDSATGTGETGAFWATTQGPLPGSPSIRHQALQVPIEFNGVTVVTEEFVDKAHANELAVHVWTINDRAEMEWLLEIGVDGIMTDRPTLLEEVLRKAKARF